MKGTTVMLYETVDNGRDPFGAKEYVTKPTPVDDVLIGQPTTDDITTSTQMYGKVIRYMLGIPKGDTHDWMDKVVEWSDSYGVHRVKTFGFPVTGVEANIPTKWHMKVRCEAYDG